jgi:pimeloyl-ACP methyl ester carboxylesterase
MLSFFVLHPAVHSAETAVLLFLHGVGEGFCNPAIEGVGVRNLFRQGVPKVLCDPNVSLPVDHPLMSGGITVLAPQLPDRHTPWNDLGNVQQIEEALDGLAPRDRRRVYLIGFSKGGRAAFQLAAPLSCRAIVAIDASPMGEDPTVVANELSSCQIPFWTIWTGYPEGHKLERIPRLHARVVASEHSAGWWDDLIAPGAGARCKSLVAMDHESPDGRHVALCTVITTSRVPYDWLLNH